MLLEAAGDGTCLRGHLSVQEVVAALKRALQQAAAIVAGAAGHIVGGDIRRGAARRAEPHPKTSGQIKQDLRHKITGIAQGALSLTLSLLHEVVVRLLQQVLKENQVLQVSHSNPPLIKLPNMHC